MKREELERLVRNPSDPANGSSAARVYADPACWPEFERALYPDAKPADEERAAIRRVLDERIGDRRRRDSALAAFVAHRLARMTDDMTGYALAAASGRAESAPPRKSAAAEDPVTFVFVSEMGDVATGESAAWRAELTLPPAAKADQLLGISLVDGAAEPVDGGFFRVAGVTLPVAQGRAEIPYGLFLSGLKDAQVERITPEGVRLPGTLALF